MKKLTAPQDLSTHFFTKKALTMQVLDSRQDSIIKNILFSKSIQSKKTDSKILHSFLIKIANRELTKSDWDFAQQNFDEKTIINHICNGSLGIYNELKESMSDKRLESEMISRGEHPLFVNSEDAKLFHANTYHPTLVINSDSLGTPTYMVLHKVRNSSTFKGMTLEELRAYLLSEFHVNPPIHVLKEELKHINEALSLDFASETEKFENRNDLEALAMKELKAYSTKNHLSFQQSNELALRVKKNIANAKRRMARDVVKESFLETFVGSIVESSALIKRR